MKIANEFTVSVPIEDAWDVLTDLEQVIPLMPGAQVTGRDGDDVLGKVSFDNRPLRDLLVEAIRYGDQPEVRHRLTETVEGALDEERLRRLLDEEMLVHDAMDAGKDAARRRQEDLAEDLRGAGHTPPTSERPTRTPPPPPEPKPEPWPKPPPTPRPDPAPVPPDELP